MDLPMTYNEEEEWKRVMLMYDSALKEVLTKIEILNNEFKLAHQYNPIEHVTSRIKSPHSIAKKIRHNGKELTIENVVKYINDVAGIRIICSFTSDIYRIADLLTKQSDVQVLKVKDYIMCPKANGYTSYHMIVSVPIYLSNTMINTKVEIQIRTIAMDFWASLEHKIYYKYEGNAPERIRKELKECADIVAYLDKKMLSLNEEIKTYSIEDQNIYSEMQVDYFQEMIRESYGTVVDEDVDNNHADTIKETQNELNEVSNMIEYDENLEIEYEEDVVSEAYNLLNENPSLNSNTNNNNSKKDAKGKDTEKQKGNRLSFLGIRI